LINFSIESAEVRNNAEQLAYSIEKLIKDNDDKLPDDVKTDVQADVDALKTALQAEDDDAVQKAFEKLNESQTKLGEAIYASTQTAQNAEAPAEDAESAGEAASDEDIVDAELVDDEEEPKEPKEPKAPKK
jgi:molecular chaperone DnaK